MFIIRLTRSIWLKSKYICNLFSYDKLTSFVLLLKKEYKNGVELLYQTQLGFL